MKYYIDDGKQNIKGSDPAIITLEEVLATIDSFPTEEERELSFIGFINPKYKNDTIQFKRYYENQWLIDIPVLENNKYIYSLQNKHVETNKVKEIVKLFNDGKEFTHLLKLEKGTSSVL